MRRLFWVKDLKLKFSILQVCALQPKLADYERSTVII